MVRSSYIIIVSGMGDDVPILGAVVTLYGAPLLHLFTLPPKSKTPIKTEIIVVFTSHFRRTKKLFLPTKVIYSYNRNGKLTSVFA